MHIWDKIRYATHNIRIDQLYGFYYSSNSTGLLCYQFLDDTNYKEKHNILKHLTLLSTLLQRRQYQPVNSNLFHQQWQAWNYGMIFHQWAENKKINAAVYQRKDQEVLTHHNFLQYNDL